MIVHRALVVVAATAGIAAAVLGSARPAGREAHVTAMELAGWIHDRKPGLVVIDVRPDSEFQAYHIPSAEHAELAELARRRPVSGETVVVYGAGVEQARALLRSAGVERVVLLEGGLLAWMDDVMNPVLPRRTGDARDSLVQQAGDLSRYFGGVPRTRDAMQPPDRDASAAGAVARAKRRGC